MSVLKINKTKMIKHIDFIYIIDKKNLKKTVFKENIPYIETFHTNTHTNMI